MSWQTRQLASFIAAGYMIDTKKGGNPGLDAAQVLAFDEIEEAQIEESIKRQADAPLKSKADDPAPGSFERFMGTMGNPYRWAGR